MKGTEERISELVDRTIEITQFSNRKKIGKKKLTKKWAKGLHTHFS